MTAQGSISITDTNAGQAFFKTSVIASSGDLGSLSIAANGSYVYSVADSKVQYLGAGETKVDTFTVTSLDGTTKQVAFTIVGVNDTAMIGTPTVVDVTEDATSPILKATGSISITDADQNQAAFKTTVASAAGNLGTLVLQSNGSYTYSVADSAVQYLGAGQVKTDTFTVTSLDGTPKLICFNVHGTNDAAVIGTPDHHDVTEDASNPNLSVTGSISITDADQGQSAFKTIVNSASGNLGSLVLAANGTYTYSVANAATQYLGAGDTKVDTFTVTSLDGTQKQISFTIHGINDAAVIGVPTVHDVTEDAATPVIYATGTVSITDADQGESAFQPTLQAGNGNLGALVMGSNGAYIYAVLDSAVQYLGAGETKVDSFTLTALDGTSKVVAFTIHGTNDAAVIGAPAVHDVAEDVGVSTAGNLSAAGTLSISDADQNQASFQTTVTAAAGTLGHLSIAADGAYSYTVADSAVQYLGASDSKVEIFTVTAFDGTQKQVSFTIHGANDAAAIGTPTVHDVTKNASPTTLTATGVISVTDADQNQASFQTTVGSAAGNLGHLVIAANGAYTYSVANSATQYLGAADVKVDTFTVTSLDGTPKQVTFTIHGGSGAGTPATIGNPSNATVTEDVGGATLTAIGTILVTDPDAGQAAFQTTVAPGSGNLGGLVLQSNGSYTYSVADSAVQYLGAGEAKVDTFTIKSIDGTSKVVSFTVQGANDAATISDPVVHSVTEDVNVSGAGNLTATGQLTAVDADQNQSSFQAGSAAGAGNLGALAFAANGTYTYSVANSAVQSLGANDSHIDTFTVHSLDGTVKVISFTVQGANDAATISDPVVHSVTEDLNPVNGNLTATGQLTATDVDNGQSSFQLGAIGIAGNLGTLTLAANGTYTYSVANSATQSLGAGQTHTDSFTIHSLDDTPKTVTFDVIGANDAAVISDPVQHDVTEDTGTTLSVSGQITATDPDQGQSQFGTSVPASGNLGHLTITSDGHYTYSVDNALVQGLAAGEIRIETFTVSSIDGTQKPVSFTIHGTQDAPILTADNVSGADDGLIQLSIKTYLVDDSGTLGTVSIKGIPDTYTLNHGTPFEDGHWEVSASDLGTLALVPGAHAHADTLVLQVSVASIESGHPSVATTSMTVDVTAGLHDTSNRAVDGYIAGAFVFADKNGNGVFDDGEASAITNADGSFTLHNPVGTLIMTGGTDVSTGLAFSGTLKAPEGSTVVTPLTTLITSLAVGGVSAADATLQVAAAFHLDGVELTTFDPVPTAIGGDPTATAVLSAGVQVQSTVAQISAVGASSADVFDAIAGAITAANTGTGDGTIDLSTGTTVASIVSGSGVTGTAADLVTSTVSAANDSIQAAANVTQIAQAGQVAQGAATTELASAAATNFTNTDQLAAIHHNYIEPTGLASQVASAEVAAPGIAVLGTSGNDVLTGTIAIDTIDGLEGNDQISGGDGADQLFGGAGSDQIAGNAGNDKIDGGTGFDRATYTDATGSVTVNMAAGTVSGAGVGSDTLVNVEGIIGSDFADTYDATGFAGVTGLAGAVIGYNEFEGGKGNDQITGLLNVPGQALTRISYIHATDGVTMDIQNHTAQATNGTVAQDLASIGQDSFSNVSGVIGSAFNDTLRGTNNGPGTYESYEGRAGNDLIDGRGGYDIAVYSNDAATTAGITVHLAAGTVVGDATIGTDTLVAVEAVRGTNFADVFDATGFGAGGANIGSLGNFNDFQGAGGDDTIIGNGATRLNYTNAAGAVTADLQGTTVSTNPLLVAGTATALGEGTDSFTGVNAVQGSAFGDTLLGSNLNNTFTGLGGDDYMDGRGGFDVASYNSLTTATTGVSVNLAAGTATGINDGSIGHDTLRSIEGVQGTFFADTFDATGYGLAGAANVSNSNGSFNQFEGLAGDDVITGNGNTRVIYGNALAAVTVNLSLGTAHGTIAGDAAGVGTDLFTGGIFSVTGSAFGDTLIGNANSNMFVGGGGSDAIDGGAGGDVAIFSGTRIQYTVNGAGQVTVQDTVGGRDGTDTLTNVEVLQFTNANVLVASGTQAAPVDLSDTGLFFNAQANALTTLTGSADDYVKINQGLSGHTIDLGAAANDTVILGITGGYNLTLANVEHLVGTAGDDFVGFSTNLNGLTIDMGGGNDNVSLANGSNSLSVTGAEILTGSDFAPGNVSNDTLTLQNTVSGLSVNLGNGINTLNLTAGVNSFTSIYNVDTVVGSASNDTLTVGNGLSSPNNDQSVDLGGGDDTLQVGNTYLNAALHGVEHLVGSTGDDFYSLTNNQVGLSVDLGAGNDYLVLANGANAVAVTNVENINGNDFTPGVVSDDTLTLLNNVSGLSVNLGNGHNTLNLAAGANSFNGTYNVQDIYGSASEDTLTVNSQFGSFALHGIEHLAVAGQNDAFYVLTDDQNGLSVDLGAGNTGLQIASGANTLSLTNVSVVGSADFFGGNAPVSDDTLTLSDDVSGVTVNLQQGDNTLNLAAGTNSVSTYGVQHINGSASADALTLFNAGGIAVDLGAGNDSVDLVGPASVTVKNVEHVNGSAFTDFITDVGVFGTTVITGGGGADFMTAGAAVDVIRYTDASESSAATAMDDVNNFDATQDQFLLDGVAGLAGSVHFMASGVLDGSPIAPQAEAILVDVGGQQQLQIDVNGDGVIGAGDISVIMNGLNGHLSDANFAVVTPNHAPTDILLSGAAIVPENSAPGSVVGLLSDMDPDAADGATYALTSNPGGLFAIVNGNQIVTTAPLDFEQAASHQVTVQVTDTAGATFSKNFQIGVTNVNEAPTDVTLSNNTVAENSAANAVVGFLTAVDPDAESTATYEMIDDAGGLFSLVGNQVVTTGPLDFEQTASHQITVRATDGGGLTVNKTFTIATTDVNEAPTAVLLSNSSVAENSAANTVVGALSVLDPDASDSATFTLTSNPGGLFAILNGNLVTTAPLDFEQATSHSVTVRATDAGGLTHDTTFAIGTTNINEAPTDISLSNTVIPQGTAHGNVVGTLSALDPDAGDTFSYTLTDNAGGQFGISGGNVVVAGPLTTGTEQITVTATDAGGLSFQKTIGITVNGGSLVVGTVGPDTLPGTPGDDTIQGLEANDRLQGFAGNDILDGGQGFDRAVYTEAASAITVNLAAGTVTGGSGSDTLINIEGIVGSENADTFDATGFAGDTGILGTQIGFNEFEGRGGNDTITGAVNSQGALLTRISYANATGSVTVDLQAHSASGDSSVGTDNLVGAGFGGVVGSAGADTLLGTANANGTVEIFEGRAGADLINGRGGFDRADYSNDPATTSGITVNMTAGTVTGDGTVGTDTLRSVESVRGTNKADSYDATGFSGTSGSNLGSNGTFNEFVGMGGDDNIIGNNNTRISYINATGGVVVDMQTGATPETGTADGDASTGHDNFSGVNNVQGSMFNDTIFGSNIASTETFYGGAGNDTIDGRGGFDLATYNNIYFSTGGVTVNMAAGTATGDASIGSDTLRSIEGIQGTNFIDHYDATGYGNGAPGALNIGNNGNFNQFEGLGGYDVVTGNGNTRLTYGNALAAVTVDLSLGTAHGTAAGDLAAIGTDTFTGGVNSIAGSGFGDTLIGDANSNTFIGGGGNDTIDGGGKGDIAIFSGARTQYTITVNGNQVTVQDNNPTARDGTDTLMNVEILQFTGVNVLTASGTQANPVDLSDPVLFFGAPTLSLAVATGSSNDYVKINQALSGHVIDLGAGTDDTVMLGITGGYNLTLANVEHVVGTAGDDFIGFNTNINGLTVDMGDGIDTINLVNGSNWVSEINTENLNGSDWTGAASNDTLTLLNDVTGLSVNLAQGTNTLNLAAGTNSLAFVGNIATVNGTGAADALTLANGIYDATVDLGGDTDTLTVGVQYDNLTLLNVEHLVVTSNDAFYTLNNNQNGLSVDLGTGATGLQVASGANALALTNVSSVGTADYSGAPSDDTLTLMNDVSGLTVNLQQGSNTLNLAAGVNDLVNVFNVDRINGSATDDVLTIEQSIFTPGHNSVVDFGDGNDTLNLNSQYNGVTIINVEHVNGSTGSDFIIIGNTTGTTTVTGGTGADNITASAAADNFNFNSAAESQTGNGDTVVNFDASSDTFMFTNMTGPNGFTGPVHFVDTAAFDGSAGSPHSEARVDQSGGNATLQIDVNGNGVMDGNDIEILLANYTGTLHDQNFLLS
nr:VCBS domain-containing protein [Bradyrhizobium sp. 17]